MVGIAVTSLGYLKYKADESVFWLVVMWCGLGIDYFTTIVGTGVWIGADSYFTTGVIMLFAWSIVALLLSKSTSNMVSNIITYVAMGATLIFYGVLLRGHDVSSCVQAYSVYTYIIGILILVYLMYYIHNYKSLIDSITICVLSIISSIAICVDLIDDRLYSNATYNQIASTVFSLAIIVVAIGSLIVFHRIMNSTIAKIRVNNTVGRTLVILGDLLGHILYLVILIYAVQPFDAYTLCLMTDHEYYEYAYIIDSVIAIVASAILMYSYKEIRGPILVGATTITSVLLASASIPAVDIGVAICTVLVQLAFLIINENKSKYILPTLCIPNVIIYIDSMSAYEWHYYNGQHPAVSIAVAGSLAMILLIEMINDYLDSEDTELKIAKEIILYKSFAFFIAMYMFSCSIESLNYPGIIAVFASLIILMAYKLLVDDEHSMREHIRIIFYMAYYILGIATVTYYTDNGSFDSVTKIFTILTCTIFAANSIYKSFNKFHMVEKVVDILFMFICLASIAHVTIKNEYSLLVSLIYIVVAAALIVAGFIYNIREVRKISLGCLIFFVFKMLVYDIEGETLAWKVIGVILAGLICLGLSYVYDRLDKKYVAQSGD